MAIGNVDLGRMMTSVHQVVQTRQHEETRPAVEQGNMMDRFEQQVESKLTNVHQSDNADNRQKKFDAREKGSNEYTGNGGRGKKGSKDKEKDSDGMVRPKIVSGFDAKI